MRIVFDALNNYIALFILPVFIIMLLKPRNRLWYLRLLVYAAAIFLLLKPNFYLRDKREIKPRLNVYIDQSRSMLTDGRIEKAFEIASMIKKNLSSDIKMRYFSFGENIEEISSLSKKDINAVYPFTDIASIFYSDTASDAILIISDGKYNKGENPLLLKKSRLKPVYTISIGRKTQIQDLALEELITPGIAFRDENTEISFVLRNHSDFSGYISLMIKESGNTVSKKRVKVVSSSEQTVSMKFKPEEVGLKYYSLSSSLIPEEVNTSNNTLNFQLQVNRQKIRVLYVSGQPSWEYSFLRRLIKSDPQIELLTFLILRNPENITIVNDNELSLIHFPAREMFTQKIYDFDLLIYEDFSYKKFFPKSYLTHIKKFVMNGGGFIMMGGPESFVNGNYEDTPIADILPVSMDPEKSSWLAKKFKVKVASDPGHPLLDLSGDRLTDYSIWKDIPYLEGYFDGLVKKAGAEVLLATEKGVPIMTVDNVGKGRAMALNTNTTWMWAMGFAAQGKSPYYYNVFWYNIIRYMIQTGKKKKVQVFPNKKKFNIGEKVIFNIRVLDEYNNPFDEARVQIEMAPPSSLHLPLIRAFSGEEKGWYTASAILNEAGRYNVRVQAYDNEKLIGEDNVSISSEYIDKEIYDTSADPELLKDISVNSGAVSWKEEEFKSSLLKEDIKRKINRDNSDLRFKWDNVIILIVLLLMILSEWLIRKLLGEP